MDKVSDKITIPLAELAAQSLAEKQKDANGDLVFNMMRRMQRRAVETDQMLENMQLALDEHRLVIEALVAHGMLGAAQQERLTRVVETHGSQIEQLRTQRQQDRLELSETLANYDRHLEEQLKQQNRLAAEVADRD